MVTKVEPITVRPSQVEGPKLINVSKATPEQVANDPLLKKLKDWDKNGDGVFSTEEVMQAANDLLMTQVSERHAKDMARRLGFISLGLGFLLLLCMAGTFVCTLLALQIMKDAKVPQTSGVMLTNPAESAAKPVATSAVKVVRQGLSGIKESTKEELDKLDEISFFHDYAYHRLKVSQIHRYDGRIEIWGSPSGLLVVEDTGEVHYSRYGLAGAVSDACWGANATTNSSDICGEAVDNRPPHLLEVEDPVLQDPENAPTPSPVGNASAPKGSGRRLVAVGTDHKGEEILKELIEVETEHSEHARRLSSRRRSISSSSRSRSSSSTSSFSYSSSSGSVSVSPRRRSFGTVVSSSDSSVYSDTRRRSSSSYSPSPSPYYSPSPSPSPYYSPSPSSWYSPSPSPDIIIIGGLDGSSRRRDVDYYGDDSRRRAFTSDYSVSDVSVNGSVTYRVSDRSGVNRALVCDSSSTISCVNDKCSCAKKSTILGWVIGISVSIGVLIIVIAVVLIVCKMKKA